MRRLIKIILILILLPLVALVAIPFVIPVETLKKQAVEQIEQLTGRSVAVGAVSFSVFPNIALSADDVKIGNPDWAKDTGSMMEVKNLRIGVELMPLLKKDVHVTTLSLDTPKIHLIKQGEKVNWQFGAKAASKDAARESAPGDKAEASSTATPPLRLDSFSVNNGSLVYEDSATGTKHTLSAVNAKLSSRDLPKSMTLSGDAVYNGTRAVIAVTLGTPFDLPKGEPSSIDLKATVKDISLAWNGTIALKGGKPTVTGTIILPQVDTTTMAGKAPADAKSAQAAPASGERWSSSPISMQALGAANADVKLEIGKLILTKLTLDNVKAHVKLQNGALNADVEELKLFSGGVKLAVSAQQSGAAGIKAAMNNVQVEELLMTLAQSRIMVGVLNGHVDFDARGNSQKAMVSSLAGNGGFKITDGSYRGGNFVDMTRNVATSFQRGTNEAGKTDFKELSGTFTAKDGVIFNNDLKMTGTLLTLDGAGQIDLPQWLVHYLLTPVLVTNRGYTPDDSTKGIAVPVKVEGSLDAPSYHPELKGILEEGLKNPEKVKEGLKNVKENLKDIKNIKNIDKEGLQNLLR